MNKKHFAGILLAIASISSFAAEYGSKDYSTAEAGRVYTVKTGKIVDLRVVDLRESQNQWTYTHTVPDNSNGCAAAGAVGGGLLGSQLGGGNGRYAAIALLAAAGGLAAKQGCTPEPKRALELTIRLDTGGMIALVQAIDADLRIGDEVRLVEGQKTRVARINY